jgi:MYXO-CTERM domain-containing protein
MKLDRTKLLKLASMGGASLAFAQSVQAATVLSGGEAWPGTTHNSQLPNNYGSNVAGTSNIALSWGSGPTPEDRWDYYNSRTTADYTPFATWPSDPAANGVFQMNAATNVAQTIVFTPDTGYAVKLQSLDLNDWVQGPNGDPGYNVAWSVTGGVSGTLGSGTFTTVDGTNQTFSLGDLTGAFGEALTLSLTQLDGASSYLAMDNLAFDQVAVPEPASAALGILGLGALALRRRRD